MKTYLNWKEMSAIRKIYFLRLIGRSMIFFAVVFCLIFDKDVFYPLEKGMFFQKFGLLHLLWGIWMVDMLGQIVPISKRISLGSLKLFAANFRPILGRVNKAALKEYIVSTTKSAYKVMIVWIALIAAIGIIHGCGYIDNKGLFLITTAFYVCDLICVLIFCPFRLMMKNRCCTTCRIFNWDHFMMFSPMLFMPGFFGRSLLFTSLFVFFVWEAGIILYPERFWEKTNIALQCANCTDKLCTQYCQKLRPRNKNNLDAMKNNSDTI